MAFASHSHASVHPSVLPDTTDAVNSLITLRWRDELMKGWQEQRKQKMWKNSYDILINFSNFFPFIFN